jgi:TRAP transporter 4TM/12TM fusion protein
MIPLIGFIAKFVSGVCLCWSLILAYTAGFGSFHPAVQGVVIFGQIALVLCFLFRPIWKNYPPHRWTSLLDMLLIVMSIISCTYVLFQYEFWMANPASATTLDIFLGTVLLVVVLEASRRSLGSILSIFALIMIAYALLGHHIPGNYGHPEFTFYRIIERLYTSGEGFSGLVVYIISTMVAIFIILGAVLSSTQMGQVLIDLAKIASGRLRGGAALIAVVSSALFGTISGSGPANVVTIGTFTIPMMKRLKYKPEFAAAVESVASTGGQIMPPIMGAGAFIMAEMLGKSYLSICVAAALPAILYFLGAGMGIYFEALRINLPPTPKEEIPKFREVLRWSRLGPIISFVFVLLYLMVRGYTPQYSCFWAFIVFTGLFIFTTGKGGLNNILTRARMIFHGFMESGRILMELAIIALCVQIIISMVSLTGVGIKFSETILSIAGTSVILSLILSSVLIMVLGMGVPTTAAYLIGISVLGAGLTSLGLDPVGIHLFIFYFACISLITPPVCIAVYIAASIAETKWLRAGLIATRLGVAAYIVPFMFVFSPALLLKGSLFEILSVSVSAIIGVILLAAGMMGFLIKHATMLERVILCIAAICLIKPGLTTDALGIGLCCVVVVKQLLEQRRLIGKPLYEVACSSIGEKNPKT